jgi:pimeloyl-ACP methyl ester carboxylesterase
VALHRPGRQRQLPRVPYTAGRHLIDQFESLVSQFTDRFHVLGLTRRGQGRSEKPDGGHDIDTLVADIVGFLDAKSLGTAHIAGHSVAGAQMIRLAARTRRGCRSSSTSTRRSTTGCRPNSLPRRALILRQIRRKLPSFGCGTATPGLPPCRGSRTQYRGRVRWPHSCASRRRSSLHGVCETRRAARRRGYTNQAIHARGGARGDTDSPKHHARRLPGRSGTAEGIRPSDY